MEEKLLINDSKSNNSEFKSNNSEVMSNKQIDIFGEAIVRMEKLAKDKRNWENRFQRWSNKEFHDGRYGYGACGYGSMCDYCKDNSYGRPCVRALNQMLRERQITLDYKNITFEEVWDGDFQRKAD